MEKQPMYPQAPPADIHQPCPPSYDQATNPIGFVPLQAGGSSMPMPNNMQHPQVQTQQPQPQQVIIVQQGNPVVGPHPTVVTCPNCHQKNVTRVEYAAGSKTHLMAVLMCVFGLFCCSCLPYCIDSCQNANHYCKACGQFVGTDNGGTM